MLVKKRFFGWGWKEKRRCGGRFCRPRGEQKRTSQQKKAGLVTPFPQAHCPHPLRAPQIAYTLQKNGKSLHVPPFGFFCRPFLPVCVWRKLGRRSKSSAALLRLL